jgi:hypothetical protein
METQNLVPAKYIRASGSSTVDLWPPLIKTNKTNILVKTNKEQIMI